MMNGKVILMGYKLNTGDELAQLRAVPSAQDIQRTPTPSPSRFNVTQKEVPVTFKPSPGVKTLPPGITTAPSTPVVTPGPYVTQPKAAPPAIFRPPTTPPAVVEPYITPSAPSITLPPEEPAPPVAPVETSDELFEQMVVEEEEEGRGRKEYEEEEYETPEVTPVPVIVEQPSLFSSLEEFLKSIENAAINLKNKIESDWDKAVRQETQSGEPQLDYDDFGVNNTALQNQEPFYGEMRMTSQPANRHTQGDSELEGND
jgi:hypothetical protein